MIKVIEEEAPDHKSIKEIENHYFCIKEAFLDGYTHLLILEFESRVGYYFSIRSKNIKSLVESMESSLRREDVNRNQLPSRYDALKNTIIPKAQYIYSLCSSNFSLKYL